MPGPALGILQVIDNKCVVVWIDLWKCVRAELNVLIEITGEECALRCLYWCVLACPRVKDSRSLETERAPMAASRAVVYRRAEELPPESLIFGKSAAMQSVRLKVEKIASTSVPVLIQGDSGTGKGVLARYIHARSPVANAAFVKVNCAAIPGPLLESELFGYERGAFTGAYSAKPGRVELAQGGTLFLDGINEIDFSLQGKLLHLLQDGQFSRIGGQEDRHASTRFLCATNRSLDQEVDAGRFRQDLFFRVNALTLSLAPLRSRAEDILDIAGYFLESQQVRYGQPTHPFSPSMARLLVRHPWPGNIRELENLVERYVILGSEDAITSELLDREQQMGTQLQIPLNEPIHLKKVTRQAVLDMERRIILRVLEANHWNRKRAASALRISYRALLYKIRQAGLPPKRSQPPLQDATVKSRVGGV